MRSTLGATFVGAAAAFCVAAAGGAATGATAPPAVASPNAAPLTVPVVGSPVNVAAAPTVKKAQASSSTAHKPRHAAENTGSSTPTSKSKKSKPKHRATTSSSGAGCGQRAVTAGVFDPTCEEYQGYLDPGRAAGRGPSSGDLQSDWTACTAKKSDAQCRAELN